MPINITDPEGGVDLGKNLTKIFIPTKLAAHLVSFTVYSLLLMAHSSEFHQKKIRSSWMKSKITYVHLRDWIIRVPVKCETKQKRNGTKRNRSKRNKSKRNETDRNEPKQIETKRNKTKRNKSKRNGTNDMASHCGQISIFSNTRKSFLY